MVTRSSFVEVADRVLVARYPQWDVNVGLVLGRHGAVVVDTRASAVQGGEVVTAIRGLGLQIRLTHVVNTHVHFDHTFGNIAFTGATIHAHERVARDLAGEAKRIRRAIGADPGDAPEFGYTAADLEQVLATRLRPPDRTFASSATIDLGDRALTLAWTGRGHTAGDVAVRVPDADVVFLGDLVEESAHPSLGPDCWPLDWAETLTAQLTWIDEGTVVVPGHGRVAGHALVSAQRDELARVAAVLRERRLAGMSLQEARSVADDRLPYPLADLHDAIGRVWEQLEARPDGPGDPARCS